MRARRCQEPRPTGRGAAPQQPASACCPARHELTASGFSPAGASFLALRSFLISARALRLRPRWNLQQAGRQGRQARLGDVG